MRDESVKFPSALTAKVESKALNVDASERSLVLQPPYSVSFRVQSMLFVCEDTIRGYRGRSSSLTYSLHCHAFCIFW